MVGSPNDVRGDVRQRDILAMDSDVRASREEVDPRSVAIWTGVVVHSGGTRSDFPIAIHSSFRTTCPVGTDPSTASHLPR